MNNSNRRTADLFPFPTIRYMFRPSSVTISAAVQNVLIECSCIAEMLTGMSVFCEWIDWLTALENWGWCNEVYGVHTVHNVHTVHTVRTLYTVIQKISRIILIQLRQKQLIFSE
jgi:hypothetical protein